MLLTYRLQLLAVSVVWGSPLVPPSGLPGGSDGKESASNVGDLGSIPGWERPPGGGHGNSFQFSCLENPQGKEENLAGYSPWGPKESDTTEQLSTETLALYWLLGIHWASLVAQRLKRLLAVQETLSSYSPCGHARQSVRHINNNSENTC